MASDPRPQWLVERRFYAGFVLPTQLRELRLVSRQMQKFTGILAGEKNRLQKVLTDGGIRLSAVVSDIQAPRHAR